MSGDTDEQELPAFAGFGAVAAAAPAELFFSGFANVAQVPESPAEGFSGFANFAQAPTAADDNDECEDFVMAMEEAFGDTTDAEGALLADDAPGGVTPTGTGSPVPYSADIPLPGLDAHAMGIYVDGPADATAPADGEVHRKHQAEQAN